MKIVKKNPDSFSIRADRARNMFSEFFRHFYDDDFLPSNMMDYDWNPKVDVFEKDNNIIVKADLAGVDEKNLDIEIEGKLLTIKGSKEEEHEEKEKGYRRIERSSGSFSRTITLPENINQEKIVADYKNGVLSLTIPKTSEAIPKKISVKVN